MVLLEAKAEKAAGSSVPSWMASSSCPVKWRPVALQPWGCNAGTQEPPTRNKLLLSARLPGVYTSSLLPIGNRVWQTGWVSGISSQAVYLAKERRPCGCSSCYCCLVLGKSDRTPRKATEVSRYEFWFAGLQATSLDLKQGLLLYILLHSPEQSLGIRL